MPLSGVLESRSNRAPKCIIYGPPGVGKSSFAATADNCLLLDTENGVEFLNPKPASTPHLTTWPEIWAWLQRLENENHGYTTVFVDTLDWLMRRLEEHVCGGPASGDMARTLHKAHGGYGNGKLVMRNYVYQHLLPCLDRLVIRGTAIVLVAHARLANVTEEGVAVKRGDAPTVAAPDIMDGFLETFVEWADLLGYVQATGDDRALVCSPTSRVMAKNRCGIRHPVAFHWDALCQAMLNGGK